MKYIIKFESFRFVGGLLVLVIWMVMFVEVEREGLLLFIIIIFIVYCWIFL